jgi:hypothetical protein
MRGPGRSHYVQLLGYSVRSGSEKERSFGFNDAQTWDRIEVAKPDDKAMVVRSSLPRCVNRMTARSSMRGGKSSAVPGL